MNEDMYNSLATKIVMASPASMSFEEGIEYMMKVREILETELEYDDTTPEAMKEDFVDLAKRAAKFGSSQVNDFTSRVYPHGSEGSTTKTTVEDAFKRLSEMYKGSKAAYDLRNLRKK